MKRIKRIASLLLAMAMIFAMSATVLASANGSNDMGGIEETGGSGNTDNPGNTDDTSTPPENQDNAGTQGGNPAQGNKPIQSSTYNIYQIFTGTYDDTENKLSAVKWGQNGKGPVGNAVDQTVLDVLNGADADKDTADNNYKENDTIQLNVIEKYANLGSDPYRKDVTSNASDGSVTCTDMAPGYYLIKGTVTFSDGLGESDTLYVVRVTGGTLTFTPKVDVPTVDKKIKEDDNKLVDANAAPIGGTVTYEITGTLPSNYEVYKTYTYKFTDTLSKGLTYGAVSEDASATYVGDLKVEVDGTDITSQIDNGEPKVTSNEDGTTTITVSIADLKKLTGVTITKDSKIVVTYTATVNEDAVIGSEGNSNKVKLEYSNNPNWTPDPDKPDDDKNPPTGQTPEEEVKTYTTELEITKHDENGSILSGAGFTLTSTDGVKTVLVTGTRYVEDDSADPAYFKLNDGSYTAIPPEEGGSNETYVDPVDGTYQKYRLETYTEAQKTPVATTGTIEAVTGNDGKVKFKGLGAGSYTLTETITPAGYNSIAPIEFTVVLVEVKDSNGNITGYSLEVRDKDGENKLFKDPSDEGLGEVFDYSNGLITATIVNNKGTLLPSTGGIGTTIFYVVGGVLVAGAGILLVTKKRMSARSGR